MSVNDRLHHRHHDVTCHNPIEIIIIELLIKNQRVRRIGRRRRRVAHDQRQDRDHDRVKDIIKNPIVINDHIHVRDHDRQVIVNDQGVTRGLVRGLVLDHVIATTAIKASIERDIHGLDRVQDDVLVRHRLDRNIHQDVDVRLVHGTRR